MRHGGRYRRVDDDTAFQTPWLLSVRYETGRATMHEPTRKCLILFAQFCFLFPNFVSPFSSRVSSFFHFEFSNKTFFSEWSPCHRSKKSLFSHPERPLSFGRVLILFENRSAASAFAFGGAKKNGAKGKRVDGFRNPLIYPSVSFNPHHIYFCHYFLVLLHFHIVNNNTSR